MICPNRAVDCINGTVLDESVMPQPFINFTKFWSIYETSDRLLDESGAFVPAQSSLTIYNSSRLYINQQGCVNTLRNECKDFSNTHGRAGENHTAHSRFPCFYTKVYLTKCLKYKVKCIQKKTKKKNYALACA